MRVRWEGVRFDLSALYCALLRNFKAGRGGTTSIRSQLYKIKKIRICTSHSKHKVLWEKADVYTWGCSDDQ